MNCPNCHEKLIRTKYAGANVRECPECRGSLLKTSRAAKIERRINKDVSDLKIELANRVGADIPTKIRCPECRAVMQKREIEQLQLKIDDCNQCGMSWFDSGELAALQLAFEQDEQTIELNRMRERLKNMTEEERLEYDKRISELRDLGSSFSQAFRGATFEMTTRHYWWASR